MVDAWTKERAQDLFNLALDHWNLSVPDAHCLSSAQVGTKTKASSTAGGADGGAQCGPGRCTALGAASVDSSAAGEDQAVLLGLGISGLWQPPVALGPYSPPIHEACSQEPQGVLGTHPGWAERCQPTLPPTGTTSTT